MDAVRQGRLLLLGARWVLLVIVVGIGINSATEVWKWRAMWVAVALAAYLAVLGFILWMPCEAPLRIFVGWALIMVAGASMCALTFFSLSGAPQDLDAVDSNYRWLAILYTTSLLMLMVGVPEALEYRDSVPMVFFGVFVLLLVSGLPVALISFLLFVTLSAYMVTLLYFTRWGRPRLQRLSSRITIRLRWLVGRGIGDELTTTPRASTGLSMGRTHRHRTRCPRRLRSADAAKYSTSYRQSLRHSTR